MKTEDIVGLTVCAVIVLGYAALMVPAVIQQHYCDKLDAIKHRFPHLRCWQPAADSGPHETRWGHGLQDCYMTPREMWKHLERSGALRQEDCK